MLWCYVCVCVWQPLFIEPVCLCVVQTPSGGAWPTARFLHSAVLDGGTMILFGGANSALSYRNDVWVLTLATMTWSPVPLQGTPPPGVVGHTATLYGGKMWVMGIAKSTHSTVRNN